MLAERFGTSALLGKLACINYDIPNNMLKASDQIKQVISGEQMMGEFKNQNAFSFSPYATLLYAGNEMPRSFDHTHGFYRRFLIIPFSRNFSNDPNRRDPEELHVELIGEKEGILKKALQAYTKVEKTGQFSETAETEHAKAAYQMQNEPVKQFIADCIIADMDGYISVADMNANYKHWCDENGYKKVSAKRLEDALTAEFAPDYKKASTRNASGQKIRAHIGVEFNNDTDIDAEGVAF